jgi:hypothetical protein
MISQPTAAPAAEIPVIRPPPRPAASTRRVTVTSRAGRATRAAVPPVGAGSGGVGPAAPGVVVGRATGAHPAHSSRRRSAAPEVASTATTTAMVLSATTPIAIRIRLRRLRRGCADAGAGSGWGPAASAESGSPCGALWPPRP